jgi:hypothetical protein
MRSAASLPKLLLLLLFSLLPGVAGWSTPELKTPFPLPCYACICCLWAEEHQRQHQGWKRSTAGCTHVRKGKKGAQA